jgi:bifunctional UDP-N-acetylglucosamine pyrophosphorylase/glucosamine-1-phosphate N-acetyltransferase
MFRNFFLSSLESHVADSASVHPSTIIQGNVYIDEGAKVHEYSKIIGPAYIGKNTVVGNYSMISGSVIGEDCVIGGYSEVTRSFIGPMVWTHRAYIGDSIVEGPGNFAAGSVTANLRFDKKSILTTIKGEKTDSQRTKLGLIAGRNVEIGINASTMPGVKLAPGTKVMPGSVLFKDNE